MIDDLMTDEEILKRLAEIERVQLIDLYDDAPYVDTSNSGWNPLTNKGQAFELLEKLMFGNPYMKMGNQDLAGNWLEGSDWNVEHSDLAHAICLAVIAAHE